VAPRGARRSALAYPRRHSSTTGPVALQLSHHDL